MTMATPATFGTPAGWAQRCTFRDDSAPHQIRLHAPYAHVLEVTCTCRKGRQAIATIKTTEEAWRAYNGFHEDLGS